MKYITKTIIVMDADSLKTDVQMLGIHQKDMAKALNVSTTKLSRWINGICDVPEAYFKPIEKYIDERKREVKNYLD